MADYAVLLDVYPAREEQMQGITSARLASDIGKNGAYVTEEDLLSHIDRNTFGAIIIMGAGDMDSVIKLILNT